MKSKTFTGATKVEAKQKAREWWAPRKGLRLIDEHEMAVGDAPSLLEAHQWAATIVYEEENSN